MEKYSTIDKRLNGITKDSVRIHRTDMVCDYCENAATFYVTAKEINGSFMNLCETHMKELVFVLQGSSVSVDIPKIVLKPADIEPVKNKPFFTEEEVKVETVENISTENTEPRKKRNRK